MYHPGQKPLHKVGTYTALGFTSALARILCTHGAEMDGVESYAPKDLVGAAGALVTCFGPATSLVVASAVDALLKGRAQSEPRPHLPRPVAIPGAGLQTLVCACGRANAPEKK